MSHLNEKSEPGFGQGGILKPDENHEANLEARRNSTSVQGRRMSRIGPPPKKSLEIPIDDNSSGDEYDKLVEMEANDAIKYRTCSWQKVIMTHWRISAFPKSQFQYVILTQTNQSRLPRYYSPSISAWPLCHSPTHTRYWGLCRELF